MNCVVVCFVSKNFSLSHCIRFVYSFVCVVWIGKDQGERRKYSKEEKNEKGKGKREGKKGKVSLFSLPIYCVSFVVQLNCSLLIFCSPDCPLCILALFFSSLSFPFIPILFLLSPCPLLLIHFPSSLLLFSSLLSFLLSKMLHFLSFSFHSVLLSSSHHTDDPFICTTCPFVIHTSTTFFLPSFSSLFFSSFFLFVQ